VDIVDNSYATVASPTVTMGAVTFSFSYQTTTGILGSSDGDGEQIYVANPDGADSGWTIAIAANDVADLWDGSTSSFDFNDPTGSGETNGQMTIDASESVVTKGTCLSCTTGNVTKGGSTAFDQGVTDSATLMTGEAASDDIGDWTLREVSVSQKIPAEKPAEAYAIQMVITIAAI